MSEPAIRAKTRTRPQARLCDAITTMPVKAPAPKKLKDTWYAERMMESERALQKAEEAARDAQAELARVNQVISAGQFASWIAHEINQPMAAVVTNGDAALRWLSRDTPDLQEAREAIERMIRDANRAVSVVEATRAMVTRDKLDLAKVDLNHIVEEALLLTQAEQRRSNTNVQMRLAADLPLVKGDRTQLQQVVLNLVLNGIDAMKAVDDRPRELFVQTELAPSGDALVLVEDCGTGVDPANLKRIFEPFFTTKAHGMGLGLPISRCIVRSHGGRLWASPSGSGGAIFQFTIPGRPHRRRSGAVNSNVHQLAS